MAQDTTSGLTIDAGFKSFIETEVLKGLSVSADTLWQGLAKIVTEFAPRNRAMLAKRDALQSQIDAYFDGGGSTDPAAQETFLREIGYLAPEGPAFSIETANVDPEIATICGPQLVVPITNARFALNACNAR